MSNSVRFDERPKRLGLLAFVLGVLAIVLVWLAVGTSRDQPSPAPAEPPPAWPLRVAPIAAPVAPALPQARVSRFVEQTVEMPARPAAHCPYQLLDISPAQGKTQRSCVASTRVAQSGDLRIYLLEPQGVSEWTLRIDTGNNTVMAASLSAPAHGEYVCDENTCTGFSIGDRDAQGGRAIIVQGAVLTAAGEATGSGAVQEGRTVSLHASLAAPGDQLDPHTACDGISVAIVERSGAVLTLCPSGGAGVARFDHDRRVYSLRGSAGDTLLVGVDATGVVDQVQIGNLQCQGYACGGATTQPGNEPGNEAGRVFTFSGTTISDGRSGGNSATLNGSAVLPEF